jgi:RimJ/RimL family protein N-acetyltransferase
MSGTEIETPRLLLRPPSAADLPAHAQMMADPLTAQFLTLDGKTMDAAAAWRTWALIAGHWAFQGFGFFSAIDKSSGAWVGRVGPWFSEGWPDFEIGWAIHPTHRGKGYALEAAIETARFAFNKLNRTKVVSLVRPHNANSRRVAEKLGETITGSVELFGAEADIWSIDRDTFAGLWGLKS